MIEADNKVSSCAYHHFSDRVIQAINQLSIISALEFSINYVVNVTMQAHKNYSRLDDQKMGKSNLNIYFNNYSLDFLHLSIKITFVGMKYTVQVSSYICKIL